MPLYKDITGESDLCRNRARVAAYKKYLQSVAEYLPDETKAFALSDWYYSDLHRSPHDAWVDSLEIGEDSSGERQQNRALWIQMRLLSASHAGHIHFHYKGVTGYRLDGEWPSSREGAKHGDWLADEISLASEGQLVHEISFSSGITWRIQSNSIRYEYLPIAGKDQSNPHAADRKE